MFLARFLLVLLVATFFAPATASAQEVAPQEKTTPPRPRFSSVDDYIAKQEPAKAKTVKAIVDLILKEFPELETKIAWNIPTIHRQGKYVVGLSVHTNHISFSPFSATVLESFKPRLTKFVTKQNLFHVPVDWKVEEELVTDLVRARLAELR